MVTLLIQIQLFKGLENISDLAGWTAWTINPWSGRAGITAIRAGFEEDTLYYSQYLCSSDLLQMVGRRSFRRWLENFIDQDSNSKKVLIQLPRYCKFEPTNIKEAGADGSTSVQSIQDARVKPKKLIKTLLHRSELHVLEAANEAGGVNIFLSYSWLLRTIFTSFKDYPAQVTLAAEAAHEKRTKTRCA